ELSELGCSLSRISLIKIKVGSKARNVPKKSAAKRGRSMSTVTQRLGWLAVLATVGIAGASADDEIQVYNAEIADVGKWTAQHHLNYALQGRKEPEFPGGLIPNHTLNGTGEYAYGVTDWFEFGMYTPYALDKDGFHTNAGKLRTLFVTPD